MVKLPKLQKGDKVAVLSPSWAGPSVFPWVYELGLERLRKKFELEPVEYPTTRIQGSAMERSRDLVAAFEDPEIKAVLTTIGGNDQITYIKNLPSEPFVNNPKPFFGYSDNSHFANFLWLNSIPSYYGGSIMTQFAMQKRMDHMTEKYLQHALFDSGEFELHASTAYNDQGHDWADRRTLTIERAYEPNHGWHWDGGEDAEGVTWGGCVESVDEMLRHGVPIPTMHQFSHTILVMETSEELPSPDYVRRVYRALGERGILSAVKGLLVGRTKAWEFDKQNTIAQKAEYKRDMRNTIFDVVRGYNEMMPIVQDMDFGHTDPQIPLPYGGKVRIDNRTRKVYATF